jgi:lipopolysaccharide export system protein LptA
MMRCTSVSIFVCGLLLAVGCQKYPSKVRAPGLSETVAEGKKTLHYKADSQSVVFLERSKRKQMLWRQEVARGDEIVVDLERKQLLVNGRKMDNVEIELATYRLLVQRNS